MSLGTEANRDTEWATDRCWIRGRPLCLARGHRLRVRARESQTSITDCSGLLRAGRQGGKGGGRKKDWKSGPSFFFEEEGGFGK